MVGLGSLNMTLLKVVLLFFRATLLDRAKIAAENLALRQQLALLRRSTKRPIIRNRDRIFWIWLSKL
jgi:hypothetical protein